ncbi:retrovirus-related pol polyprotein from transposon TNT 1-94, partial [Tanacetum coccineum]
NPYARYGVEHWKNPHAKIFYIRKQKEPRKPKEKIYSNSKIIQVIKTYWELGHEHKFITKTVARRANDCIVSIIEPDYKNLNKNDIEDIYLLIMNVKVMDYADTGLLWSLSVQDQINLFQIMWYEYYQRTRDDQAMCNTTMMLTLLLTITSDSNIILYDQYMENNEEHVVQSNVSSAQNDALMSNIDDIHEQGVQSFHNWYQSLVALDLGSTRYRSKQSEFKRSLGFHINEGRSDNLEKGYKKKEDKYIEEFLDIKKLKEKVEDRLFKQDQSVQTVHMLCKPKPFYDEKKKVAILCLTHAKQVQSALYNGTEIVMTNHKLAVVHDSEETFEIAGLTRKRMYEKMKSPLYLTPEQIFWAKDENDRKKVEASVLKPLSTPTMYPPNTPVKLVPRVLPTKSQVKISLYILTQLFTEFDKTCKKRITPTGLTEGERGFEQTKNCYLTEVIPFFKTLKQHFEGVQKTLFKEVKGMEEIFDQISAEVNQNTVDKQWQFCDSDLEIAFRKHSCFVRDMNGVDLLKGSRSTNLYTISIDDMMKSSPPVNLEKARSTRHNRQTENTNMEVLHTLHMDLCGPMRVQSINGKKYILVIVDDYSRFTWVKFLRSKDETPEFVNHFLKKNTVGLNKTVRYMPRQIMASKIVHPIMSKYYEGVGIFHQKSVPRTPQQNAFVRKTKSYTCRQHSTYNADILKSTR